MFRTAIFSGFEVKLASNFFSLEEVLELSESITTLERLYSSMNILVELYFLRSISILLTSLDVLTILVLLI